MIRVKGSKQGHPQKANNVLRVIFILYLVITITQLTSCLPTPTQQVQPTDTPRPTNTPPVTMTATTAATATTLTFITDADARVEEATPTENFGRGETLRVDGGDDPHIESFVRFTVTGVVETVQRAQLRVYARNNDTDDGPALYSTEPTWAEREIVWNNRPNRTSDVIDNKGAIGAETWVEYDVTSHVKGDGTFSFVFVGENTNRVAFSSREGGQPPQLVITTGSVSAPMPEPTVSTGPAILVGTGDISTCDNNNDELTAQLLDKIPGTVFTTGDNVYSSGSAFQFANCYDPTWGRHKERTRPVPGNHEYRTYGAAGYFQYFDNISAYYAYDLGGWRIYALNSEINVSPGSPQVNWLQADLAANPRLCVLAYWHQPRWSSGRNHGDDTEYQTLWQVLYEAGAELVLNGHEHSYERFAPMNANGEADPLGMREIVVGTGGKSLYRFSTPLPTSEVRNSDSYGVIKLTLRETSYDWEFIPVAGSTFRDSGSTSCH